MISVLGPLGPFHDHDYDSDYDYYYDYDYGYGYGYDYDYDYDHDHGHDHDYDYDFLNQWINESVVPRVSNTLDAERVGGLYIIWYERYIIYYVL